MQSPDSFEVFSSGFVGGRITTGRSKTINVRDGVAKLLTIVVPDKNVLVYSGRVEELFMKWVRYDVMNEPRSDIELPFFEEACELFSTSNILEWLLLQEQSPGFTQCHRDFLNDSIRFILTGKRKISIANWDAIFHLTVPVSSSLSLMIDKDLIKELTNISKSRLPDVLVSWLGQDGGVSDFFHSIRMMYGKALT